jgi:hypothetical protein
VGPATDDVDDPAVLKTINPLVSGVGSRGHSVSCQHLARSGVRLMGHLEDVVGGELITDDRVLGIDEDARRITTRSSMNPSSPERNIRVPTPRRLEAGFPRCGSILVVAPSHPLVRWTLELGSPQATCRGDGGTHGGLR